MLLADANFSPPLELFLGGRSRRAGGQHAATFASNSAAASRKRSGWAYAAAVDSQVALAARTVRPDTLPFGSLFLAKAPRRARPVRCQSSKRQGATYGQSLLRVSLPWRIIQARLCLLIESRAMTVHAANRRRTLLPALAAASARPTAQHRLAAELCICIASSLISGLFFLWVS